MALDLLLVPLVAALGEEEAGRLLGEVLEREARPLVRRIVRGQLGGLAGATAADFEDVEAGVLVRLVEQLQGLRRGEAEPIESFPAYVAMAAFHGCHALLRARRPARARLGSRLRYLLTHDPELALWQGANGEWLGGQAGWHGRTTGPRRAIPERHGEIESAAGLRRAVHALFAEVKGPLRLEELVEALGGGEGSAPALASLDAVAGLVERLHDRAALPLAALAERELLALVWREIGALPRRQRLALLLNLRDSEGREMLSLFPVAGLAGHGEIAAVLELSHAELEGLWPTLPLEDLRLAELLGLTRRQVINLRKCARERLARRIGGRGR